MTYNVELTIKQSKGIRPPISAKMAVDVPKKTPIGEVLEAARVEWLNEYIKRAYNNANRGDFKDSKQAALFAKVKVKARII
jgi:hypothetical protein